jgi:hypothetical protein
MSQAARADRAVSADAVLSVGAVLRRSSAGAAGWFAAVGHGQQTRCEDDKPQLIGVDGDALDDSDPRRREVVRNVGPVSPAPGAEGEHHQTVAAE